MLTIKMKQLCRLVLPLQRKWLCFVEACLRAVCGSPGASMWSGCSVRIRLWPRLPRNCHRLLSILPTRGASVECPANWCSSLDPTSAGHFSCPGFSGLGVHAGQGSLPPRAAIVAGPIWPHLVGRCGGLRLKNPVGTGPVKVSAHTTHNIQGGGDTTCRSRGVVHMPSVAAAVRAVAHPAPAVVAPVRAPLPSVDGWDLRSIPLSTGGGARCYKCVVPQCVFFLGRGGSQA